MVGGATPTWPSFRRADYLGDPGMPLAAAVRARVRAATGDAPAGPIRLLAHLRYYGHCFNPVAFYYCYEADGATLHSIVAEVTNTPWRERHAYVLPLASAERRAAARVWKFDKALHVSPFLPMQRQYRWRFTEPGGVAACPHGGARRVAIRVRRDPGDAAAAARRGRRSPPASRAFRS